jgi:hypothetical protein
MTTQITSLDSMLDDAPLRTELEASPIADGMAVDPVSHANRMLIQTANSIYLFVVTVPAERRGLLVGGTLGECPASPQLVGAITEATGASADASCLRTGSRAVFTVESDGVCKRVITSGVVRLAHAQIRSGESPTTGPLAAGKTE